MKRKKWISRNYAVFLALVLSFVLVFGTAAISMATTNIDEADLTNYGTAYEVNHGVDGQIYVSDAVAQEIWRVSPTDGAYTLYRGVGTVVDARPDGTDRIWWTDGATDFSTLTIGTTQKTTWSLAHPEIDVNLWGVTFDAAGNIWMSEWFGSSAKVHRFNPATNEHCTYAIGGGMPSYYISYDNDVLWLINWSPSSKEIIRFDPATLAVKQWPIASSVIEQGFDIDSSGLLWWANLTASLSSFDPATDELTSYDIPTVTNSATAMVSVVGNRIWYTDTSENTVGWLVPDQATGSTSTLTPTSTTATEICEDLGAGTTSSMTVESGAFDWTGGSLTTLVDSGGWTIYDLAAGANPFGIAPGGDYVWAADNGRQKLLRFFVTTTVPTTQDIPLGAGWDMISSYVDPQDPSVEAMLAGIEDDLTLIKNDLGQVYWPDLTINQIGTWNLEDGYQIHMTGATTLSIEGGQVSPETTPLDLPASWNLASYLRDSSMPVETALASIDGQVYLVKNNFGEVFWPDYSINEIGDMQSGQGYLMYMSAPGTLSYPAN